MNFCPANSNDVEMTEPDVEMTESDVGLLPILQTDPFDSIPEIIMTPVHTDPFDSIPEVTMTSIGVHAQTHQAVTTFSPSGNTIAPYRPIHVNPASKQNLPHIHIDVLNVLCQLAKSLAQNGIQLDYMDTVRQVADYQFDSSVELDRALDLFKTFINIAVPQGSSIDCVCKRFGSKMIWNHFETKFSEMFLKDKLYNYSLYIAQPAFPLDGECDDRLTVRLAMAHQKEGHRSYIISNDKYRSMSTHWNNISAFEHRASNAVQCSSLNCAFSLKNFDKVKLVKFGCQLNLASKTAEMIAIDAIS